MTAEDQAYGLRGHAHPVACLLALPRSDATGRTMLASGDGNGEIRLWSLVTRRATRVIQSGHGKHGVLSLASMASSELVSQGRDGYVKLWDLNATGDSTPSSTVDTSSRSFCRMAVLPERSVVIVPSADCDEVCLWNMKAGVLTLKFDMKAGGGKRGMCTCIEVVSAHCILSGSEGGFVDLWDERQPRAPVSSYQGSQSPSFSIAYNPVIEGFISGSSDNVLYAAEISNGSIVGLPSGNITMCAEGCSRVVSSPDHQLLASCTWSNSVLVYTWKSLRLVRQLQWHREGVLDVAFLPHDGESPHCTVLATAGKDSKIAVHTLCQRQL
ncbi:WD domain, G-beta repeat [Plasmodiophora brassicae]